jgi:hypothetical protein
MIESAHINEDERNWWHDIFPEYDSTPLKKSSTSKENWSNSNRDEKKESHSKHSTGKETENPWSKITHFLKDNRLILPSETRSSIIQQLFRNEDRKSKWSKDKLASETLMAGSDSEETNTVFDQLFPKEDSQGETRASKSGERSSEPIHKFKRGLQDLLVDSGPNDQGSVFDQMFPNDDAKPIEKKSKQEKEATEFGWGKFKAALETMMTESESRKEPDMRDNVVKNKNRQPEHKQEHESKKGTIASLDWSKLRSGLDQLLAGSDSEETNTVFDQLFPKEDSQGETRTSKSDERSSEPIHKFKRGLQDLLVDSEYGPTGAIQDQTKNTDDYETTNQNIKSSVVVDSTTDSSPTSTFLDQLFVPIQSDEDKSEIRNSKLDSIWDNLFPFEESRVAHEERPNSVHPKDKLLEPNPKGSKKSRIQSILNSRDNENPYETVNQIYDILIDDNSE